MHRHEDAAERVDVPDRIEADASQVPGGRVAEFQRRERVRGLMERDGEQDDGQLDHEIDDLVFQAADYSKGFPFDGIASPRARRIASTYPSGS